MDSGVGLVQGVVHEPSAHFSCHAAGFVLVGEGPAAMVLAFGLHLNDPLLLFGGPRDTPDSGFAPLARAPPVLQVLLVRGQPQVVRVDACRGVAHVVHEHAFRD